MEWLQKILAESAVYGEDGKLDVTETMKKVNAVAFNHIIPKDQYNTKVSELKTANDTIETLKKSNADNETLQSQIDTYKTQVKNMQVEAEKTKKSYVLKSALKDMGCTDPDYLIYKHGGVEKFTFDAEGKPVGIDEAVKPYKEASPVLFPNNQKRQPYTPGSGALPQSTNPFAKDSWNLTEQGKLYRENPAQARELAATAGVTI